MSTVWDARHKDSEPVRVGRSSPSEQRARPAPRRWTRTIALTALCHAAAVGWAAGQWDVTMGNLQDAETASGRTAEFNAHGWRGTLHDNVANAQRQGSGFNPLSHAEFPGRSLFLDNAVGLNFEHVFNGAAADRDRSMFTPRTDPCVLHGTGDASAALRWPADGSTWGIEADMTYDLVDRDSIDLRFTTTFTRDIWPQGYVAMMWASYMNRARDRRIHFYGREGDREGWVSFGDTHDWGFEVGTVRHDSVGPLPSEEGAQTLNLAENPVKTFLLPVYYGLMDGDGDPKTTDDTMAYTVMFDQAPAIRFAMWNFVKGADGKADTHSPAWDWQFLIRSPEIGRIYAYRCRILYKPFRGREAVLADYHDWRRQLDAEEPSESR